MKVSKPNRKRNLRGQGTRLREEIEAAALRLVDAGADPITLRAVAREAGISAPSIYDHFGDLEEIVSAVVDRCFTELTATVTAARDRREDPVERLEAGCGAYLAFAVRQPRRYALLFVRERDPDPAAGASPATGATAFATLVDGIAACAAAGASLSQDPFGDAVALWSAMHGYASLRMTQKGFPWPEEQATLQRIIHRLARIVEAAP